MKRLIEVFTLTVPQQRAIVALLSALIALALWQTYRGRWIDRPNNPAPLDYPSPSPGMRP